MLEKVKKVLSNGCFELEVNNLTNEAVVFLNDKEMIEKEVDIYLTYSVSKKEDINYHSINGMSYYEDLSEVVIDNFQFELVLNASKRFIDLSEYESTFAEIIAEYYELEEI